MQWPFTHSNRNRLLQPTVCLYVSTETEAIRSAVHVLGLWIPLPRDCGFPGPRLLYDGFLSGHRRSMSLNQR
jgi:hypothetical protein